MSYAYKTDVWNEINGPFSIGEGGDRIQYPANYTALATPDELAAIGVKQIVEPDPVPSGHKYLGSQIVDVDGLPVRENITEPFTEAELAAQLAAKRVGTIVSMWQARRALKAQGLLSTVQQAIDSIPDPDERETAQIDWEYATEVRRVSPLIASLGPVLRLSDEQIDALFEAAAAIQ